MLKRLALLLSVVVVALLMASPAYAQSSYAAELDAAIEYYFPAHEEATAKAIVACESGYGADIYNEYSGAYGPWQFLASSSYGLGYDHGAMVDPWYATWAAYNYWLIAGWSPWACAY